MLTRRGTRASEGVLLLRRNVRSHKDNENSLEKTVAAEDVITEEEEHVARNDVNDSSNQVAATSSLTAQSYSTRNMWQFLIYSIFDVQVLHGAVKDVREQGCSIRKTCAKYKIGRNRLVKYVIFINPE